MPIYFSWFITALLFAKWWSQQSQPTAKWAPFILRVIAIWTKSLARRTLSRVRGTAFSQLQHSLLSDNRPRCAARTFVDDLASGTPGRSNGETAIENP